MAIDISSRDAEWYEEQIGLTVVYREEPSGATLLSKKCFLDHRHLLGGVQQVYLVYVLCPTWDFLTYVVDVHSKAIVLNGFAWGYGGEGPRGLQWLFEQLGFDKQQHELPSAHKPGAWRVHKRGLVTPA